MSSKTDIAGVTSAPASGPRYERSWTALLVATVLVAAALRFLSLQSGLWFDEIVTLVRSARQPIRQIVTEFGGLNVHPLYSVLAHASIEAFGESAWALRLPACLFGIASVIMVYLLAARVTTRIEAWAAAAVLATSYHHVWFSQNARGYTMLGFLTLFSTFFLVRGGQLGRPADYILYGLACAAGIYTHLTMAFVVAGHAAVLLVGRAARWHPLRQQPIRPLLWAWGATALFSLVAYAPFGSRLLAIVEDDTPRRIVQVATASWAFGEAVRGLVSGAGVPAALAAGIFAAIGAVGMLRRHPPAFALLVAPGIVTAVAVLALGQPLRPRFFFLLSGAGAIFVGRGIGATVKAIAERRAGPMAGPGSREGGAIAVCTLALVAISAAALPQNYRLPKQDFDGAVRFLEAADAQGAQIAAAGPACLPLEIYYAKTWRCITSLGDWPAAGRAAGTAAGVFVVYTLAEYIEDPQLRVTLLTACPVVRRFAGTLGGGDVIVCDVTRARARS